ncbi:MAG: YcaO-like family protein [Thermodesulfobacteriota bacterium]
MSNRIVLEDCYKTYTLDQDKAVSPQETVKSVRDKLARLGLDILRYTERLDRGRLDIPVYVSACGDDALEVMPTRKQMGKGATPAQAEASAVMEMVERYSFFHFLRHEPFIRAAYADVADRAMPLAHIAASVHHDPLDLDRAGQALAGLLLSWTPAFNLTQGREMLVPFDWFYEINEFNGPAAGNRLEEAVIQGLGEIVERHVSALVCRGRLKLPFIDLDSLETAVARELVAKYRRNGIRLFVKDFTLNMVLPTVGALAYDPSTFPASSEIVYTAGTATDPEKALIRALTEVAQLAGDFNTKANFVASGLPKYTALEQADYVTAAGPAVPISALPNIGRENIKAEIEAAVDGLARRGFEVYAVNVTHPDLEVPAVYTIIPGAHFRERAKGSSVPFFAAKLLSRSDDQAAVLTGLGRLSRLYPNSYFLKFFEGQALLNQDRPAEAAEAFQAAAGMEQPEEDLAGTLTYLGLALKELEDYDRAIEALTRSAALDGERRDTFNLLGFCYYKTKKHEQAIEVFEKVIRLDPGSAIDYANIGSNYRELGRRDEAVSYYKTALELDPTLTWVWDNLSKLL